MHERALNDNYLNTGEAKKGRGGSAESFRILIEGEPQGGTLPSHHLFRKANDSKERKKEMDSGSNKGPRAIEFLNRPYHHCLLTHVESADHR